MGDVSCNGEGRKDRQMTVETVRECGCEWYDKVAGAGVFINEGCIILDARIIRGTCPTCGGSGKRKDKWAGGVREVACPDCADVPVFVIEPAAWEAAMGCFLVDSLRGIDFEDTLSRILQALLPGARVAEEVLTALVMHGGIALSTAVALSSENLSVVRQFESGPHALTLRHGDDIAILATQAQEEVNGE